MEDEFQARIPVESGENAGELMVNTDDAVPGTKPEEIPRGLDVRRQLHEAVLGVDAPVDGPGRRPATAGRRRLPHLHGEHLRHPPLLRWDLGTMRCGSPAPSPLDFLACRW